MREFIHYGHKKFDQKLFKNIKNWEIHSKPKGGLWASDIKAKYGWKDWCKDEDFCECYTDNSFVFGLKPDARILVINKVSDLEKLPRFKTEIFDVSIWYSLDFEQISKDYDVMEVNISKDPDLYWKLYGWDCDSIVVMNPDVIIVKKQ